MTEQELAEIRERIAEERSVSGSRVMAVGLYTIVFEDAPALLAEVERLRTHIAEALLLLEPCYDQLQVEDILRAALGMAGGKL